MAIKEHDDINFNDLALRVTSKQITMQSKANDTKLLNAASTIKIKVPKRQAEILILLFLLDP